MNLFKNFPISTKLLIILLLVSILPLFIVTYEFERLGKTKLTGQTIHVLKVQTENVTISIKHYLDYKFNHLYKIVNLSQLIEILKSSKEVQPHSVLKLTSSLRDKLRIDPDFLAILLLNSEGDVVLSTASTAAKSFATRPFFYEAHKGKIYVSPPCLEGDKPVIYFSVPVKHAEKKLGVVAAQCKAEEFWNLIENENGRLGFGNAVILSNSDGVRIAHSTTRKLIFKSWMPLKPEIKEQILKEKRYGSNIKDIACTDIPEVMGAITKVSPPKYFQHRLAVRKGTYHSVLKVMDNGWRIMSTMPESTFLNPVRTSTFYMGIFISIITCLIIVASIVIGRLGTKRINLFASISKEVAKGNFAKEIPFTDGDEIGQLGKSFNIMVASIRRKIEQLKYLNDVALKIHSHIKIEHLFQDLVNISKKIISAEIGFLILLDDKSEKVKYFEISLANPVESHNLGNQSKELGLLNEVLKKGLVIRLENILDNISKDFYSMGLLTKHQKIDTVLGVPLKINNKPLGGLFLANKIGEEGFTLEDEEILLTISYQAAVAIENARLYAEVQELAITDGLTNLFNHREFHRRLDESINGSKRYHYKISLLMIDIDHFKLFNDTFGHQVGDLVLKTIGHLITAKTRSVDICARYGGEEFAVILGRTDTSQAMILSERIRSAIFTYPFVYNEIKSQLSVSIGIATFPMDANTAEDLIKKADEALYTAKKSGRNKVVSYKSIQPER